MTKSIEISAQTFLRLQAHAVPLVDTIDSVINRLIDFWERNGTDETLGGMDAHVGAREFNPLSPPDLTHTKVLDISFCGKPLERGQRNWNGLLNVAVKAAKEMTRTYAEFDRLMVVNFFKGEKNDEGFRYMPDIGISLQGQDANGAWKGACHIACQLGLPLTVTFAWREKEGAQYPGVTGGMKIAGK